MFPAAAAAAAAQGQGGASSKKNLIVIAIIVLVVVTLIVLIYFQGKKAGKGGAPPAVKLPPGVNIPTGWTPDPDVIALYGAMKGAGTDEATIWKVLEGKNKAQLALIYNRFSAMYHENLLDWFREDLSGDDLTRALNFFYGVV